MNDKPKFMVSNNGNMNFGQSNKFQGTESQMDLWNDPDLIPPPVVMLEDEDNESEQ